MAGKLKIAIVALTVLAGGVFVWSMDDSPDPRLKEIRDSVDWRNPSDSYLFLLGFEAPIDRDPMTEGREVLREIREYELSLSSQISQGANAVEPSFFESDRPSIESDQMGFSCYDGTIICALKYDKADFSADQIDLHRVVKQRFLRFVEFEIHRSGTRPHYLEPIPVYSTLMLGKRLAIASAFEDVRKGRAQQAAEYLRRVLRQEREYMRQADTLIGKMIAMALVRDTLDALAVIANSGFHHFVVETRELSLDEISLSSSLDRELLFVVSSIESIDLDEGMAFSEVSIWGGEWLSRLGFKRNISISNQIDRFQQLKSMTQKTAFQFAEDSDTNAVSVTLSWFRNPVGSILFEVSSVGLDRYFVRGYDLQAKVRLLNSVSVSGSTSSALHPEPINPFTKLAEKPKLNQAKTMMCLGGPFAEYNDNHRCISALNVGFFGRQN